MFSALRLRKSLLRLTLPVTVTVCALFGATANAQPSAAEKGLDAQLVDRIRAAPGNGDKPFVLVATFKVKPDQIATMHAAVRKSTPPSRRDKGALLYEYQQDVEDPTVFVLLERWQDLSSLQAHFNAPHFREVAATLSRILAEPPQVRLMSTVALN